jgi:hypothetical protein
MMRLLLLAALFLGCSALLSGCGIISHQAHRAANLLRVPVRLGLVAPPPPAIDASAPAAQA